MGATTGSARLSGPSDSVQVPVGARCTVTLPRPGGEVMNFARHLALGGSSANMTTTTAPCGIADRRLLAVLIATLIQVSAARRPIG
jgi:hypothetical protein